jgi:dihydrodipicolinate synthase/N-acetylneuraminate lyase
MRINTRSKVTVVAGVLGIAALLGSTATATAVHLSAEAARHQAAQVAALAPQDMPHVIPQDMPHVMGEP